MDVGFPYKESFKNLHRNKVKENIKLNEKEDISLLHKNTKPRNENME